MFNSNKLLKSVFVLCFLLVGTVSNAQTLTTATTVKMDYCVEVNKVQLSFIGLPADATNIKWYQTDSENKLTLVASDVSVYISKIAMKYYATFTSGGTSYKTAEVTTGSELVVNGNFELGATTAGKNSFYTEYTYGTGDSKKYAILKNATTFYSGFKGKYDHTKGDGTGFYMVVDGATDLVVWRQTIKVQPNTTYYLSAWALKIFQASSTATNQNPELGFSVNGTDIGTKVTLSKWTNNDVNPWLDEYRFYATWYSGSSTSAVVQVVNYNNNTNGNDFGLDDISFGTFAPESVSIDGLNGNAVICEGTPLSITANVSGGCPAWYEFEWINNTDTSNPVKMSTQNLLEISYPTIAQHGGEWKAILKDPYTTDTLSFTLNIQKSPEITYSTSCITVNSSTGLENNDGSIKLTSDNKSSYRLLNSSGTVLSDWSSSKLIFAGLASGTYTVEAKFTSSTVDCISSSTISLSSEPFALLPPEEICQGTEATITVSPSICCYEWSYQKQTFSNNATYADLSYKASSSLFSSTYTAGTAVSYKEVGVFKLDESNSSLSIKDNGSKQFTYSIYEFPFNPSYPAENYITTVKYDLSVTDRTIKNLSPNKVYIIIANAPSTTSASFSDVMFMDVKTMSCGESLELNWFDDANASSPITKGTNVSTNTLFPGGAKTPGIYDFYVSCCENDCNRDKVTITINPVPVINPLQTICAGSSTNIQPKVLDLYGNEIDTNLFPIEYKWTVVTSWGLEGSKVTASSTYQSEMIQSITLAPGYVCGQATYKVTARIGGSDYACESTPTNVAVRVVDLSKIKALDEIAECVEHITSATWNELDEPDSDIKEARPDYKIFEKGETTLDFSTLNVPTGDCKIDFMENFEWWITKDSNPTQVLYSGIQQPSADLINDNIIKLELSNAEKSEAYTITYQISVRCGSGLYTISRPIIIHPRPTITKM